MYQRSEKEIIKSWKGNINNPLVSICSITYNHESYIEDALDSFLMQETDFPFEIIIDDDCSTDNTSEIIRKYVKKFPNIIKENIRSYNVGASINSVENMERAKGKYIAYCDGDDYWTDPLKLRKQVDFLEKNQDYVASGHDAFIIDENGELLQESKLPNQHKKDYKAEDLILGKVWILSLTLVFRNIISGTFPPEQHKVLNWDTFMISWLGLHGKSKYHSDIKPAAYRAHSAAIWSPLAEKEKENAHLNTFYWMYRYYDRIGENRYAQFHLIRYNKRAISRSALDKPSISILISNKDNLRYYPLFSKTPQLPFNLRLYFNSNDGIRPLHNVELLDIEENKILPFDEKCCLPESDYLATIDEYEVLTENDIVKYLEYKLGIREENTTSLREIQSCHKEIRKDRVSVIIPTYKRSRNLKNAIASVVEQDYPDIEAIIISDNGKDSEYTEETRRIASSFEGQNPNCNIVLLEHSVNRNGAAARNTGILNSTGEYICFLDDDDIYLPGRLSQSIKALKATDKSVGAVFCGYTGCNSPEDDSSRYKRGNLTLEILLLHHNEHYLHTDTTTYKRETVLRINGFDETYCRHQDLEFNLRFFELYTVESIKESLVQRNPISPEVHNQIFDHQMMELKQKFLNQFSYIIQKYDQDLQKSIYEAHWKEAKRLIENKDVFIDKLKKNYKEKLVQVLDCTDIHRSKLMHDNLMNTIEEMIKTSFKKNPIQKYKAYKLVVQTFFETRQ